MEKKRAGKAINRIAKYGGEEFSEVDCYDSAMA